MNYIILESWEVIENYSEKTLEEIQEELIEKLKGVFNEISEYEKGL